ncbi:mechanosensitive ion channel family protein [Ferruginibacter paludis]|uniref:mechanosensitive ion channel family protein n=1 Tax=Ferruginibacter paludis TaxID=1310417 RepID=UPI0025B5A77E|nr:mechanosensitive ion channel family protein [Ferruginibacter paludis]MDN3656685.1 mechanosensitive ion channel family protein [Ferruginibacter paludis]
MMVAAAIAFIWLLLRLTKRRLLLLLKNITTRTTTKLDDVVVELTEKFILSYGYLFINYNIIKQLYLSPKAEKIAGAAMMVITTYFTIRLANFLVSVLVVGYMKRKQEPQHRIRQVDGMLLVLRALVWAMGIIMLIDNLGYNVTTIIAGLGVGGIAIALAAQSILGDLFSYIVIFFDKPFEIGDFIVMGENSGVVETIGIKTSHIRSLDGQQLIMPNAEMVKSIIQNFKRLERRRIVFSIGVVYNTSADKLRRIPAIAKDIIALQPEVHFDRVHLKAFGDFSINYEIVYYLNSADYVKYMDVQQAICLAIFEAFEEVEIEFAFPTQTLFINNRNDVQAPVKKRYTEAAHS